MSKSAAPQTINRDRSRVRVRVNSAQFTIEHHAMQLRSELRLSDQEFLHHELALRLIPKCEVWALKNIPNLPFEHVVHFREWPRQFGAFAYKDPDGDYRIVFNDSYSHEAVRVHLMEEFFHIRLGHSFDTVRLYPTPGQTPRTHSHSKEQEAYGCAMAALVPYGGLEAMLARGEHIARIAECYCVPVHVVEHRIGVTGLSDLITSHHRQLSLLSGA
jgi:hypothetical protein